MFDKSHIIYQINKYIVWLIPITGWLGEIMIKLAQVGIKFILVNSFVTHISLSTFSIKAIFFFNDFYDSIDFYNTINTTP